MKALDFNAIQLPTWQITLKDEAKTVVNLVEPSVELVDRMVAASGELQEVAEKKDGRTIKKLYELVAEVLTCNDDGFKFTAEELRNKYKMTLLDIFRFVAMWLEFVNELKEAKN